VEDFKSISVTRKKGDKGLKIVNPTSYKLLGQGMQGAVFQLTSQRCVKIFASEKQARKEIKLVKEDLDGLPFVPEIFDTGSNYIVMEYLRGVTLEAYLKEKRSLNESLTKQIVDLVKEMKRFNKTDIEIRHIFVTEEGVLKKIDHGSRGAVKPGKAVPHKLFKMLDKLQLLDIFLKQVKEIDFPTYSEWKRNARFK